MQAHYTRLFTDDQGESRFEDLAAELMQELSVSGADSLPIAPFLSSEGTFWVGGSATWKADALHPAPRRGLHGERSSTDRPGCVIAHRVLNISRFRSGALPLVGAGRYALIVMSSKGAV